MRAAVHRSGRFLQRDKTEDAAGEKVEFGDGGSIPERDEAALAVGGHDGGVGQRGWYAVEGGEVEAVDDFAVGGVEKESFIGTVGGDEETLDTIADAEAKAGGIGDVLEFVAT